MPKPEPVYIRLKDGDKVRDYKIPTFGEFTIADWMRLCMPENTEAGHLALLEEASRMMGVPKKVLREMDPEDYDKLVEGYVKFRFEANERQKEVEGSDFTNPKTIEHDGVVYELPDDIERRSVAGQWIDLQSGLEGKTHEPEVMALIAGCLLVPQGEKYKGPLTDKMQTLPVRHAMGITSFFLPRSERLRNVIAEFFKRRVMSLLHGQGQEGRTSTSDTGSGTT